MNNLAEMIKEVQKYFNKPLVIKGKCGNFNDTSKISFFSYKTVRYLELSLNYRLKFDFYELEDSKYFNLSIQYLPKLKSEKKRLGEVSLGCYTFKREGIKLIIDCGFNLKINDTFQSSLTQSSFYLGDKYFKLNTLQDLC